MSDLATVISACASLVTAIGVIVVAVITRNSGKVLKQVEKQGNSVSLELKRTNMVYARRLAVATEDQPSGKADKAIADDAQRVYEEARAAAERDGKTT